MPDSMQVWLPVEFNPVAEKTGFSDFQDQQLKAVTGYYRAIQPKLICPEPIGFRDIFSWDLRDDLARGAGDRPALRDFSLLVEAIAYGLVNVKTFDLQQYGFTFYEDWDRYVTVLIYKAGPAAPESVAGFFSPRTLVCPAANWRFRDSLEGSVQNLRNGQAGNFGRALLRTFQSQLPGPGTLWSQALGWLLSQHQVTGLDPGEANQSNVGPLLLEMGPGAMPQLVFIPSYSPGRMPSIIHRLHGSEYQRHGGGIAVIHNGQTLCSIMIPQVEKPKLFGLGAVEIPNVSDLPASAEFDHATRDLYESALAGVINPYASGIASDPHFRFTLPDVLRAAFHAMGEYGARAFLSGQNVRWVYSDKVSAAGLAILPHQGTVVPGQLVDSPPDEVFFADNTDNGRVAYYLELWHGHDFSELTSLGSALWHVFRAKTKGLDPAAEALRCLQLGHHRLIPMDGVGTSSLTA